MTNYSCSPLSHLHKIYFREATGQVEMLPCTFDSYRTAEIVKNEF